MNIIQLLHPKALIDYIYDDTTCRQALEIMGNHGFTAVPVIDHDVVMYPHIAKSVEFIKTYPLA